MTELDPNIQMIETIVDALGPLAADLVLVGGCAAGLLMTDSAGAAIRATTDVDLVLQVAGFGQYIDFAKRLAKTGFKQSLDQEQVCRWQYGSLKIDVMPTDEKILGFTNKWYFGLIQSSNELKLPSSKTIRIVSGPYFVATKLEAFFDRGNGAYQSSHDIEDIISIVDRRPELATEIESADEGVRIYLNEEFERILAHEEFVDSIAYHMRPDSASQSRVPIVIERMRKIAGL
ncbi:MAG: hypothetical protein ABI411_19880 [Tahibacter sp.]